MDSQGHRDAPPDYDAFLAVPDRGPPVIEGTPSDPKRCSRCRKTRTRIWNTRYTAKDPQNLDMKGLQVFATCNHCAWRSSDMTGEEWAALHTPWLFDGWCPCHWFDFDYHTYGYCPTSGRKDGSTRAKEEEEVAAAAATEEIGEEAEEDGEIVDKEQVEEQQEGKEAVDEGEGVGN
ncbi:hypothetical protein EsH8_X_000602 [Colletotrichum jinshuiense]